MPKGKYIRTQEFKQIKLMLEAGVKKAKIAKVMGRSSGAVAWIEKADNVKHMRKLSRESRNKYLKKPDEVKKPREAVEANKQSIALQAIISHLEMLHKQLDQLIKLIESKRRLF